MLKSLEDLRKAVYCQLVPANETILIMRKHIQTLYKELGHGEYSAWFETFLQTNDFNGLSEFIDAYRKQGDKLFKPAEKTNAKKDK